MITGEYATEPSHKTTVTLQLQATLKVRQGKGSNLKPETDRLASISDGVICFDVSFAVYTYKYEILCWFDLLYREYILVASSPARWTWNQSIPPFTKINVFVLWAEECQQRTHPGPKKNLHQNVILQYTFLKVIFSKCDYENLLFSRTDKHQPLYFRAGLYSEDIYIYR